MQSLLQIILFIRVCYSASDRAVSTPQIKEPRPPPMEERQPTPPSYPRCAMLDRPKIGSSCTIHGYIFVIEKKLNTSTTYDEYQATAWPKLIKSPI